MCVQIQCQALLQSVALSNYGQTAESVDNPQVSTSLPALSNTMRKPLRIALIWMLMLALPAQSMAAIGMQLCAVVNQAGALSQDNQQTAAHHPGAGAMAHHGAAVADHGAADATQPSDNRMCSLCAFCVGAVALSSVVVGNPPLPTVEPSLARPQRLLGLVADTPERPPRFLLA
jgi:hypothetical protein